MSITSRRVGFDEGWAVCSRIPETSPWRCVTGSAVYRSDIILHASREACEASRMWQSTVASVWRGMRPGEDATVEYVISYGGGFRPGVPSENIARGPRWGFDLVSLVKAGVR